MKSILVIIAMLACFACFVETLELGTPHDTVNRNEASQLATIR